MAGMPSWTAVTRVCERAALLVLGRWGWLLRFVSAGADPDEMFRCIGARESYPVRSAEAEAFKDDADRAVANGAIATHKK
jgi:hypothetical protein